MVKICRYISTVTQRHNPFFIVLGSVSNNAPNLYDERHSVNTCKIHCIFIK